MDQNETTFLSTYGPIVLMFLMAAGFVVTTMVVTHLAGPKRRTFTKLEAFESGIEPIGNARTPFNVRYFLVAILFVLFDVEVIFMYPWAVNFKDLGKEGLIEMIVFIVMLMTGFYYVVKKGVLTWNKQG